MMLRRGTRAAGVALVAGALWLALGVAHPTEAAAVGVSRLTARTNTPTSTLNLRTCAATTCAAVKSIPHGTVLTLTAATGDWFQTSYGGRTGWVHSRYTVLRGTPARTVSRGTTSRRTVSYTFDAGSDLGHTGAILDFLAAEGIPASFGLTGRWAEANPAAVKRMAAEGHHLFNHTWDHGSFTGFSTGRAALTPARRTEQLVRTNNLVLKLTGTSTRPYFRPPYGDYDSGVLRDVGANRFGTNVMWSVDSLGWKGLTAPKICSRVVGSMAAASSGGNGYIILFHVGAASADAQALPCITNTLRGRGFTFATVPQLLNP
jgi:peptidoglycan/xylan/chitin deacetylase (PgdA/CDA1 family)